MERTVTDSKRDSAHASRRPAEGKRASRLRAANLFLRVALAGLFFYAGGVKLMDPATFQSDITNFNLLPWALAGVAAIYLPWLEIIAAGALLGRSRGAAFLLGLLMTAFTLAVATAWARGLDINCGCFGASDSPTNYPRKVAENVAIIAVLGGWLWLDRRAMRPARN